MDNNRINDDPGTRTAVINGLPQQIRYDTHAIEDILAPRLNDWIADTGDGARHWALLAAPPGAGKSILAHLLQERLDPQLQCVGIDGFHHRQEYLLQHTYRAADGAEYPLVQIKGAPETFDAAGLVDRMRQAAQRDVKWPSYDRTLHDVVDDTSRITSKHVLLEGNWLLLDQPEWVGVRELADLTIFVTAGPELLRERLIRRKEQSGHSRGAAEAFYAHSDGPNVTRCLDQSNLDHVDLILEMAADGSLHERETV